MVDFTLSDKQKNLQWAAGEFARGEFRPDLAAELDQAGRFPESVWKKACQLGLIGIHYPKEFGGSGLGFFETVLVTEVLSRVDAGFGNALASVDAGSEIILKFGTREQKEKILPPLAKGEMRLSVAATEPEDEGDFRSSPTETEKRAEGYILRGTRRFVPNAPFADRFISPCHEPGEGLITLMVEKEQEGVGVRPIEKMGLRLTPSGDIDLREVRVLFENRVGQAGEGGLHVDHYHQERGLRNIAQALGAAQGAFDRAVQYGKQREQFGRRLSQFQIIRHKLAEMAAGLDVIRSLTYKAAGDYDRGRLTLGSLAIARMEAGRMLVRTLDEALQIFGGYGYMSDQEIERCYRDAWALAAELGTEEEQKDVIAREILGRASGPPRRR
jgi:acyl-CoA dehydrogenase